MAPRISARDRRVLYLLRELRRAGIASVRETGIHKAIYHLQRMGLKTNFSFYEEKKYSYELHERIEEMARRGYLKKLYLVDASPRGVYIPLIKITERGLELVDRMGIPKKERQLVDEFVSSVVKIVRTRKGKATREGELAARAP